MFASSLIGRILLVALGVILLWALFAGETGASGPERSYRVKPGDTLAGIASQFRTTIQSLQSWNGLRGSRIVAGDSLTIFTN